MVEIESNLFVATVVGKMIVSRGFIFKRTVYVLAIEIQGQAITREVQFNEYCQAEIGQSGLVELYKTKGGAWMFSQKEVELFDP